MKPGIFFDNLAAAFPGNTTPEHLIEQAADIGFEYVEADIEKLKKQDAGFFEAAAGCSVGFSVYCFSDENCVLGDGTSARDNLRFLASHGISTMMMVCRPARGCAKPADEIFRDICSSLNSLCASAAEFGITVLVEDFDSSDIPCGSCEDMLKLAEYVPGIRFTLDTGNFAFFGEDLLECYGRIRDRIGHVHLKDRVSPGDLRVPVTGTGGLPLREVLTSLKNDGYCGKISIEMFGAECSRRTLSDALSFLKTNY